jgi:filamentous hemagglutinin
VAEAPTARGPESFIEGDRLVNADRAQLDPRKITEYALNPEHPVGGNKARVFEAATGSNKSNAPELISPLQAEVANNPPTPGKVDVHGGRSQRISR